MDPSKTYTLKHPVTIAEKPITSLTFRKARSKDFRSIPLKDELLTLGVFMDIAAKLSEQPPVVIDSLDPEDLTEVLEIVTAFFGVSLPTGAKA